MRAIFVASILVVLCGCSKVPAPTEASKPNKGSVNDLNKVEPVTVDLDRDGRPDLVSLQLEGRKGVLSVIYGTGKSERAEFAVGSDEQFAICSGDHIALEVELQSQGVEEALGAIPDGYRVCETCYEIQVSGGECDPLQFFWNENSKVLDWWRV